MPAVWPVGVVSDRSASTEGVLITRYLEYSLPYRLVMQRVVLPAPLDHLLDAFAELLLRLHVTGFFWGDCSLSNTLFRRDAGLLSAYFLDAETAEQHDKLSDGQRLHDLEIARENVAGELLDLAAELDREGVRDPFVLADDVVRRYEELWSQLTREETFGPGERFRLQERLRELNALGFDVDEIDLERTERGFRLKVQSQVVEPGHHRRRLLRLTGLLAQENQARRLLADIEAFRAELDVARRVPVSETALAGLWLTEVFEPAIAAIPPELWGKREAAELYHELLEHRWYLSEQEGRDVGRDEAVAVVRERAARAARRAPGDRRALRRREPLIAFVIAGAIASALLWLGPPGSDTAAHVYQLWFFRHHGFTIWDNDWYSGRYVFVTYSWLYYPLAALVGIKLLAALSLATAAAAFARLVEYPPAVLAFAVVWGAFALSGAYPFMLGVAFALIALNTRRLFPAVRGADVGGEPAGVAAARCRRRRAAPVARRRGRRRRSSCSRSSSRSSTTVPGTSRSRGRRRPRRRCSASAESHCRRGRQLRGVFAAWLVLVLVSVAFPSQLGENAARLRFMALPLALLALRCRPLRVAVPLAALAAVYNLSPLVWSFEKGQDERAEGAAYWAPAIAFLRAHNDAGLPRQRARHGRALGGGVPARGRDPDHARLVPAGRLSRELGALPPARPADVPALAARARRAATSLVPDDRLDYTSASGAAVAEQVAVSH